MNQILNVLAFSFSSNEYKTYMIKELSLLYGLPVRKSQGKRETGKGKGKESQGKEREKGKGKGKRVTKKESLILLI